VIPVKPALLINDYERELQKYIINIKQDIKLKITIVKELYLKEF